jgi:hypothetical protein
MSQISQVIQVRVTVFRVGTLINTNNAVPVIIPVVQVPSLPIIGNRQVGKRYRVVLWAENRRMK